MANIEDISVDSDWLKLAAPKEGAIKFLFSGGEEAMRLEPDGRCFVRGELVETNHAVWECFRTWLAAVNPYFAMQRTSDEYVRALCAKGPINWTPQDCCDASMLLVKLSAELENAMAVVRLAWIAKGLSPELDAALREFGEKCRDPEQT